MVCECNTSAYINAHQQKHQDISFPPLDNATMRAAYHCAPFVACSEGMVYSIPLKQCKRQHIGQTRRCVNDRLCKHHNNVEIADNRHVGAHCIDCGCYPDLRKCSMIYKSKNRLTREIVEAYEIYSDENTRVSYPSVPLTKKLRVRAVQTQTFFAKSSPKI